MKNNIFWVCGENHGLKNGLVIWTFAGLFNNKQKAISACNTKNHFIGQAKLNEILPAGVTTWPGCYYPKEHDE